MLFSFISFNKEKWFYCKFGLVVSSCEVGSNVGIIIYLGLIDQNSTSHVLAGEGFSVDLVTAFSFNYLGLECFPYPGERFKDEETLQELMKEKPHWRKREMRCSNVLLQFYTGQYSVWRAMFGLAGFRKIKPRV